MAAIIDCYAILGVNRHASSSSAIKQAYRRLALEWHPDKNPTRIQEATERFVAIGRAYDILSDAKKRRDHDDALDLGRFASSASNSRRSETTSTDARGSGHNSTEVSVSLYQFYQRGTPCSTFTQQHAFDIFNEMFREQPQSRPATGHFPCTTCVDGHPTERCIVFPLCLSVPKAALPMLCSADDSPCPMEL
jgi:curved DNA-binding protein CbpA